mgnify:FL=1
MSFKQLMWRNLKKNLKNYSLYLFALVFNVTLYFSFVTLQHDPTMDEVEGSIKGEAALQAGSVILIVIVIAFLLYANNLFIKRRGKEIGLYQLVGMKKGKIFTLISAENMLLYFGSLVIGIVLGFVSSKLLMMILIRTIGIDEVAQLNFSVQALIQTVIVFAGVYVLIMLRNAVYIKRQRILTLFHATAASEGKKLKVSIWEMIVGILGILCIAGGYFLSSKLFDSDFYNWVYMFYFMLTILVLVIIGTYLFYKGSISFIFNLVRKRDAGYLSLNKVLSLSSIMFRMKSNSLLLTVITTVSALAIGLLSLAYISYYNVEKSVEESVIYDFSIPDEAHAEEFKASLDRLSIEYEETMIDLIMVQANLEQIIAFNENLIPDDEALIAPMIVIPDSLLDGVDVAPGDAVFVNENEATANMFSFEPGPMELLLHNGRSVELDYVGVETDVKVLPLRLSFGGFPVLTVDESLYPELVANEDPAIENDFSISIGIDIIDRNDLETAQAAFEKLELDQWAGHESKISALQELKRLNGLTMFIVAFLGMTALITTGCILYFKQVDEGEEEKGTYTILRKLGFTNKDILGGIKRKQLINFGIPLLLGLCHGYFAVKSGWFFFGTELWTPMIIVMVFYTLLYSIFAILSVNHYKKMVHEAL